MTRCLCSAVGIQPGLESGVRLISFVVFEDNSNVRAAAAVTIPTAKIIVPATPNIFITQPCSRYDVRDLLTVTLWSAYGPTRTEGPAPAIGPIGHQRTCRRNKTPALPR